MSVLPGVGFAYSLGGAVMAQSKKYEPTTWDNIKFPALIVGSATLFLGGVGYLLFWFAGLIA